MQRSYPYVLMYLAFALGVGYSSWGIYGFLVEARSLESKYLVLTITITLISFVWFAWTYMLANPAWTQLQRKFAIFFGLLQLVVLIICVALQFIYRFPNSEIASLIIRLSFSWVILSSVIAYHLRTKSLAGK
jgi:hypothetical protein